MRQVIDLYSVHLYLRYFPRPELTEAVWAATAADEELRKLFALTLLKNVLVKRSARVAGELAAFEASFREELLRGRERSKQLRAQRLERKRQPKKRKAVR